MSRIASVLERSLATSIAPEASQARRNELRTRPNLIKRASALALHDFAIRFPDTTARLLRTELLTHSYTYIGQGADAFVFKVNESKVVKINKHCVSLNEAQQQAMARQKQEEHSMLAEPLSRFILEQEVTVGPHPYLADRSTMQTWQPFCKYTDTGIFTTNATQVNPGAIRKIADTFPNVMPQFTEFLEASYKLYDSARLVPDTNGSSNVVVAHQSNPTLILLDGYPISQDHPHVQNLILQQMSALETALNQAA